MRSDIEERDPRLVGQIEVIDAVINNRPVTPVP